MTSASPLQPPSVLVVLVAKDGARWLRQCLRALSRQTHAKLGVLAVDNASTDGSADLLQQALGPNRVIRLTENTGFAGAVNAAMSTEVATQADYLLLLHDDTVLAPDAVARLVQAAERVDGAGIVGPKVLDWEHPRLLLSIGMFTDRFGYPYSPLEDDEIDQGQYDRIREVLFVSSCAMLVSSRVRAHVGTPDERYATRDEDLDFCWRARLSGFRVVVTPLAEARHRGATSLAERSGAIPLAHYRYHRERSALASMLKNYSWLSLVWLLPTYFAMGAARVLFYVATRRFEDAGQVLGAWGWNVGNLGGTLRRRARAQATRTVKDREIRRFMARPGDRARRLAASIRAAVFPVRAHGPSDEEGEERPATPFRVNLGRFALTHPVATAWLLAVVVVAIAYRNILGAPQLAGGALAAVPGSPSSFFRELLSGVRHTGLGGTTQGSPALGILGIASIVSLGSPLLLQKVLLMVLPALAGVTSYRAIRAFGVEKTAAVLGAAAFVLSPIVLWCVSEGRIPELVFLAGAPWVASKLMDGLNEDGTIEPRRWLAGAAVGVGAILSFDPGAAIGVALLLVSILLVRPLASLRRRRLPMVAGGLVLAAILAFPTLLATLGSHGVGMADPVGAPTFASLVRLSLSPGPGAWRVAYFLPVAAALGLLFASGPAVRAAAWAALTAVWSLVLAWLSGADRLPTAVANPVVFVGLAAFAYAVLIALGLVSVIGGLARQAFGYRQVGGALMAAVLTVGLFGQISEAGRGSWELGSAADVLPPALPVVSALGGSYRVLWIGNWSGGALPAPGGPPDGRIEAGRASIRYAVTLPSGGSIEDVGRPAGGPGYDRLEPALLDVLAGDTRHGGALLAPFGIKFVVATPRDVPRAALRRLSAQLDIDLHPALGLLVYQVDGAVPLTAVTAGPPWVAAARHPTFQAVASLPSVSSGTAGAPTGGDLVLLSQQFDSHWKLQGPGSPPPFRAFGWAVGFEAAPQVAAVRFTGQPLRDAEVAVLALLWLGALWINRRPATRG